MAKLYFRYGAMGSSKSANILMVRYNYEERGQYAILLKPRTDDRDGEHKIQSRIGLSAPAEYAGAGSVHSAIPDIPTERLCGKVPRSCWDQMRAMWRFAENIIKKGNCGNEITS